MKKQMLKKNNECKVTFSLPAEATKDAKEVALVGDFNDWDKKNPIKMKRLKNGSFKVQLKLARGKDYHFRYIIDGDKWQNDWDADKYEASPIDPSIENSVVSLIDE
ncbi:MAG: isoamylase early set domain-containing protein [Bacteroidia bacterium]|nr:isoamylase early set domain-containing protein [Bacteroidia bacterium]